MHSGSALSLSLPRDSAKEWVPLALATYLGVSFDIGPARIFLPLWGWGGGHIFCRLQMALLLLVPPPPPPPPTNLLSRCLYAPSFTGKPCFAQSSSRAPYAWHLLTFWSPSRIFPHLQYLCPGRLGSSLFVLRAKLSFCGFCNSGLQLRFCTAFRTHLRRVVATASLFVLNTVVSSWYELLFHI